MQRVDGRSPDQTREIEIIPNPLRYAEGSAEIRVGATRVLCAATVDERVPPHRIGSGQGWVTAEYAMLPRSSPQRVVRDGVRGKIGGRSQEIQRLIGRALRAVFRMDKFGERTLILDCDVIEADGGTRTASITGAFVAAGLAMARLREDNKVGAKIIKDFVSAISVGIVEGVPVLDLCYLEDAQAEVDMNVVMTGAGRFVEVQGTAEGEAFDRDELNAMLDLAAEGNRQLVDLQKEILGVDSFDAD